MRSTLSTGSTAALADFYAFITHSLTRVDGYEFRQLQQNLTVSSTLLMPTTAASTINDLDPAPNCSYKADRAPVADDLMKSTRLHRLLHPPCIYIDQVSTGPAAHHAITRSTFTGRPAGSLTLHHAYASHLRLRLRFDSCQPNTSVRGPLRSSSTSARPAVTGIVCYCHAQPRATTRTLAPRSQADRCCGCRCCMRQPSRA